MVCYIIDNLWVGVFALGNSGLVKPGVNPNQTVIDAFYLVCLGFCAVGAVPLFVRISNRNGEITLCEKWIVVVMISLLSFFVQSVMILGLVLGIGWLCGFVFWLMKDDETKQIDPIKNLM